MVLPSKNKSDVGKSIASCRRIGDARTYCFSFEQKGRDLQQTGSHTKRASIRQAYLACNKKSSTVEDRATRLFASKGAIANRPALGSWNNRPLIDIERASIGAGRAELDKASRSDTKLRKGNSSTGRLHNLQRYFSKTYVTSRSFRIMLS